PLFGTGICIIVLIVSFLIKDIPVNPVYTYTNAETLAQTLPVSGAIIVSTPQQVALADVVRGVELFRNPALNIPVLGFVENMSYFTPAELPDHKYYIFGKEGCKRLAAAMEIPLLGEIPLVQSIAEGSDNGQPVSLWTGTETPESTAFMQLAERTIAELCKLKNH
ncbi:MAG: P-loop NTPase, partial [Bacteroidales bacterium]|nr:P-loop NTPase [Bacteroidales bacterium]